MIDIVNEISDIKEYFKEYDINKKIKLWIDSHPEKNYYCSSVNCLHNESSKMIDIDCTNHTCKNCIICETSRIYIDEYIDKKNRKSELESMLNSISIKKIIETETELKKGDRKVAIFDVDGTLTPHQGQDMDSLFRLGWSDYSEKYMVLEEIKYLRKFLKELVDKNFIILYASRSYLFDIIQLFHALNIESNMGVSRNNRLSKKEFIHKLPKGNNYYYFEDDETYLDEINGITNVSCSNGNWLGKQLLEINDGRMVDGELVNFMKRIV